MSDPDSAIGASSKEQTRARAVALFAEDVARVRRERKLSQSQVSRRSGIHVTEVSRIERGLRDPHLSTLIRLACALEVQPGTLLERIEQGGSRQSGRCGRAGRTNHATAPARANSIRRAAATACCPCAVHLGLVIVQRRAATRMSQAALAYRADVERTYLSRVENGHTSVGWNNLGRIAAALKTTIASLALDAEQIVRSGAPALLGQVAVQGERASGPVGSPSVVALGLAFQRARLAHGFTREECADVSGLSAHTIEKLEFGKRAPKWDTLCALSVALKCTVYALVILAEATEVERYLTPAGDSQVSTRERR
jgi:transcriptional regulator with XRE-family HTH domain